MDHYTELFARTYNIPAEIFRTVLGENDSTLNAEQVALLLERGCTFDPATKTFTLPPLGESSSPQVS